jgi:hypothetical protein
MQGYATRLNLHRAAAVFPYKLSTKGMEGERLLRELDIKFFYISMLYRVHICLHTITAAAAAAAAAAWSPSTALIILPLTAS